MPITYASVVNGQNKVVLQGVYKKGQSYKMDVQRQASQFELYKTKELFLDDKLKVVYRNMDNITLCLVTTNDVDLQETGAFLEKFLGCI